MTSPQQPIETASASVAEYHAEIEGLRLQVVLGPADLWRGIVLKVVFTAVLIAGIWRDLTDRRASRSSGKAVAACA
ncbi:MAG: hypothetical protein NXI31_21765 [bacterium]|nr:hypothetical protein [bacterium]